MTDLLALAQTERFRTRNLHDGLPVPPALIQPKKRRSYASVVGYVGQSDRMDAVVGHRGYLHQDEAGRLSIYLGPRVAVPRSVREIEAIGGTVVQRGDKELSATIPADRMREAIAMIRVSKLRPGRPESFGT